MKPKVGIYSLTACEGCMWQILNLEDNLLEIMKKVDIVEFPLMKSHGENKKVQKLDIVFVEGCVATKENEKKIKEIRNRAKFLVALGTCATYGGVPTIRNFLDIKDVEEEVYKNPIKDIIPQAKSLDKVVKVDYFIRGCPCESKEFLQVVNDFLIGKKLKQLEYPVCVECRIKENRCLLQAGLPCMGPITFAGCDAICPSNSLACIGCRGPLDDGNLDAEVGLFEECCGVTKEEIKKRFRMFASTSKIFEKYNK